MSFQHFFELMPFFNTLLISQVFPEFHHCEVIADFGLGASQHDHDQALVPAFAGRHDVETRPAGIAGLDAVPVEALSHLKNVLKVGGTITVIEGDHGSTYFYPSSAAAYKALQCQVELQRKACGDAYIGRELYPLLNQAGFSSILVSPRMVYVDASKPKLIEGFTKNTFTAMIEGVRESAIEAGLY